MQIIEQRYAVVPIDSVRPHPKNRRRGDLEEIERSMAENGFYGACVAQEGTGILGVGNHRWRAWKELGRSEIPVIFATVSDRQLRKMLLVDNRASDLAKGYDVRGLVADLEEIQEEDGLQGTGYSDADLDALLESVKDSEASGGGDEDSTDTRPERGPNLAERFLVPPFSVLDCRQGYWQERKRQWIELGIRGDAGRADSLIYNARANEKTDEVIVRAVEIPEGSPLFIEIRAYMKERLKAKGISQKAVNDAVGVVGMAGHWFGNSQPSVPTPELWEKLKPVLDLDGRYDEVMQSLSRPPADTSKHIAGIVKRSAVDTHPAARGGGSKSGANPGAGRGRGGLNQQLAPNASMPGGKVGLAAPPSDDRIPRTRMTWAAGTRPPEEMDDTSRRNAAAGPGGAESTGTSMFDPVLCELMVRWFTPRDGHVVDCFAGGCTLGIVAAFLGRRFTGSEVRAEQIAANEPQAARIAFPGPSPRWVLGDSRTMRERILEPADFIFTDPPYWNLETYSDRDGDASTRKTYPEFLEFYGAVIREAFALLKDDRFMAIKIGEVRDNRGNYVNLVGDTIRLCIEAGLHYYNEGILVTAVGSLPVRAGRTFARTRKLGKTHQNVLVFVKGDVRRAVAACGEVEIPEESLLTDEAEDDEPGVEVDDVPPAEGPDTERPNGQTIPSPGPATAGDA